MKKLTKIYPVILLAVFAAVGFSACNKENVADNQDNEVLASSIEVVAATSGSDAVYVIDACPKGMKKDSVAFSTLPAAVSTYLNTNYTGYTVQKSFKINSSSGTVESYAVVIQFNGKPVGLKFDSAGAFVKVLEQREKRDMKGAGWHHGGRFDCRDGQHRDSVAISALPTAIKSYYTTTYPTDTLIHALVNKDGAYVVVSANKGLYASVFSATGAFVKRELLPAQPGKRISISQAELPSTSLSYLSATFPGYVLNKAFSIKLNGVLQGYVVLIDSNGTKYALQFNATGSFVKNMAIR